MPDGRLIAKPETNGWRSAIATISRSTPASRVGLSFRNTGTRGVARRAAAPAARRRGSDRRRSRDRPPSSGSSCSARRSPRGPAARQRGGVVLVDLGPVRRAGRIVGLDEVHARPAPGAARPALANHVRAIVGDAVGDDDRRDLRDPEQPRLRVAVGRVRRRPSRSRGARTRARRASRSPARSCRSPRRARAGWRAGSRPATSPAAGRDG